MPEPAPPGQRPTLAASIRSVDDPDRTVAMPRARIDAVDAGDLTFSRSVLEPGWRWSIDVRERAGTSSCQLLHRLYIISGHLGLRLPDGSERVAGPGEVIILPPGHDAWVEGVEPVINLGISHARRPAP